MQTAWSRVTRLGCLYGSCGYCLTAGSKAVQHDWVAATRLLLVSINLLSGSLSSGPLPLPPVARTTSIVSTKYSPNISFWFRVYDLENPLQPTHDPTVFRSACAQRHSIAGQGGAPNYSGNQPTHPTGSPIIPMLQ